MKKGSSSRTLQADITKRLDLLVNTLGAKVPKRDRTVFVDTESLYDTCDYVMRLIDDLVDATPPNRRPAVVRRKVSRLWANVGSLLEIAKDLVGPLGRLHSSLFRTPRRRSR